MFPLEFATGKRDEVASEGGKIRDTRKPLNVSTERDVEVQVC
jgi:hypothetical protein